MADWQEVDAFIEGRLVPADPALEAALAANAAAGLPAIDVAPTQGKLLNILARMVGARRILEIGTLGGYSTIWLARALPVDGRLITLEAEPRHAAVARENIARAGLGDRVEVRLGPALDSLPRLEGPFDFVFIDADKPRNPDYLDWAVRLSRPGTVIVCDNVVRGGRIADAENRDAALVGTRALFDRLGDDRDRRRQGVGRVRDCAGRGLRRHRRASVRDPVERFNVKGLRGFFRYGTSMENVWSPYGCWSLGVQSLTRARRIGRSALRGVLGVNGRGGASPSAAGGEPEDRISGSRGAGPGRRGRAAGG
jgi:predicted O-methyltransferase YrrM